MQGDVRIVLVGTTHPGNIGAAARAMKTMGLRSLFLVQPAAYPSPEATARAAGAADILDQATVCESLDQALTGCVLVAGASARARSLSGPQIDAHACAGRLLEATARGPVAVVFGRESSGLSNRELEHCHYVLQIPADPEYSALNLAAAVQIVAYELWTAAPGTPPRSPGSADSTPLATADELAGFFAHLERVLAGVGFLDPDRAPHTMRRLKRFYTRAHPDRTELNLLRGVLSAVEESNRRQ